MAFELVTTISGTTSNAYNSVAEFDAFLVSVFPPMPKALSSSQDHKARALAAACADITKIGFVDDVESYFGYRSVTGQLLPFPRIGLTNPETASRGNSMLETDMIGIEVGVATYPSNVIPPPVKRAEMWLAGAYLEGAYNPRKRGAGVVGSFTTNGVNVQLKPSARARSVADVPDEVMKELKPLIDTSRRLRRS
jgi:hypothetical protein